VKILECIVTGQGIETVHTLKRGMIHIVMEKLPFVESIENDHDQWELEEVE